MYAGHTYKMNSDNEYYEAHYNHKSLLTLPIEEIQTNRPTHLYCQSNYLTELPPDLPDSITHLWCSENHITILPDILPVNIKYMRCNYNNISKLPNNLPKTIEHIDIEHNPLQSLPINLGKYNTLYTLDISGTLITELPDLPESLVRVEFNSSDTVFKLINKSYFKINMFGRVCLKNDQILQINAINSMRRTQARARMLAPAIMEHYARRTMHPKNLAPLLTDPDADVSEFMDAYIASL